MSFVILGIQRKPFTMRRWSRWGASSIILIVINLLIKVSLEVSASAVYAAVASQNFKISPKPCLVGGVDGTCMFVWECIKSEGTHLGMCMDGFMFGSCCAHNLTDNFILPPSTPFRPPNKPTNKYKPNRPISSSSNNNGIVTIKRPNGSGTLVIRQQHRPLKNKPTITSSSTRVTTTKSPFEAFNDSSNELSASASVSASKFEFFTTVMSFFTIILNLFKVHGLRLHGKSQQNQIL